MVDDAQNKQSMREAIDTLNQIISSNSTPKTIKKSVTDLIVDDPNQQSYPTWPSFLDHILIGESFFEAFNSNGVIRSVNIDEWIGGWEVYESTISDHRPILLHLPFN